MRSRSFVRFVTAAAIASLLSMVGGCQEGHRPNEVIDKLLAQNDSDLAARRFEEVETTSLKILAIDLHEPQALFQLGLSRLCTGNDNGALDVWSSIDEPPPEATVSDSARLAVKEARQLVAALDAGKSVNRAELCHMPKPEIAAANPLPVAMPVLPPAPAPKNAKPPEAEAPVPPKTGSGTGVDAPLYRIRIGTFKDEVNFRKARSKSYFNQEEEIRDFMEKNSIKSRDNYVLSSARVKNGYPNSGNYVIITSAEFPIDKCTYFVSVNNYCIQEACSCISQSEIGSEAPYRN